MSIFATEITRKILYEEPEEDNLEVDDLDPNNIEEPEDDLVGDEDISDDGLDDPNAEVNSSDGNMSDDPDGSEGDDGKSIIQKLEDELFKDLSDSQKNIRDKEIIKLFGEMYYKIDDTISKLNRVVTSTETMTKVEFCSSKLSQLKDVLYSYITETYVTKSYIQNLTNYYEFVAVANSIAKILESINIDKVNE